MRVYLDACCLSRLTDDQSQARIRSEAEAIDGILGHVRLGTVQMIASEAIEDELRRIPMMERRVQAEVLLSLASVHVKINDAIAQRARVLSEFGYGAYDALHLAAAEAAADVLLSTDNRLIKRAARGIGTPRIPVQNPLSWSKEQGL